MTEPYESSTVRVVSIVRRLDAQSAEAMDALLGDAIRTGARALICDFSSTEYVSSAGVRVVLTAAKKLQKLKGTLVFCTLTSQVEHIFEITGLLGIIRVFPTSEEARRSLSG